MQNTRRVLFRSAIFEIARERKEKKIEGLNWRKEKVVLPQIIVGKTVLLSVILYTDIYIDDYGDNGASEGSDENLNRKKWRWHQRMLYTWLLVVELALSPTFDDVNPLTRLILSSSLFNPNHQKVLSFFFFSLQKLGPVKCW